MTDNESKKVYLSKKQRLSGYRRLSTKIPRKDDIIIKIFETAKLLCELDNNTLTLSEYFNQYMKITNELERINDTIIEYLKKSPVQNLYFIIYTNNKIIPKVYLMAIIGSLIPLVSSDGDDEFNSQEHLNIFNRLIVDVKYLMQMIVYPTNSFFARYHVLRSLKNQLNLIDSKIVINFFLENFVEMNRSLNRSIKEKPETKEDPKTLTIFIIENLIALLSIPDMNRIMFKDEVLPSITPIVYDQFKDVYNEYIINWIITGLTEEYTITGLESILMIMLLLYNNIDNQIPLKLKQIIDRLLNFFKNNTISNNELLLMLHESFDRIFGYFKKIMSLTKDKSIDMKQYIEFLETLINFILCCSPESDRASYSSFLLSLFNTYLDDYVKQNKKIEPVYIAIYTKICKELFSNNISFFEIQILYPIAKHFETQEMRSACYNLLLLVITFSNKIDSSEKVSIILEIITLVLEKTSNFDNYKNEVQTVNTIITQINHEDPEKILEWYLMIKNIYTILDQKYMQESLPIYFQCFLDLINKCETSYLIQQNAIENDNNTQLFNLSSYQTEKDLVDFFCILYNLVKDEIKNSFSAYPEINLNHLLKSLKHIDQLKIGRDRLIEQFLDYLNTFIRILLGETLDSTIKVDLTHQLIDIVAASSLLTKEKYLQVAQAIIKIGKCLQKRTDIARILLFSCDLYYNNTIIDLKKIKELLEMAFNEAEYVIVKIENLIIFPKILEKIFYFVDKTNESIVSMDVTNKIIQSINDNIESSKEQNADLGNEVEGLYNQLKEHLIEMKENGMDFYKAIEYDNN